MSKSHANKGGINGQADERMNSEGKRMHLRVSKSLGDE